MSGKTFGSGKTYNLGWNDLRLLQNFSLGDMCSKTTKKLKSFDFLFKKRNHTFLRVSIATTVLISRRFVLFSFYFFSQTHWRKPQNFSKSASISASKAPSGIFFSDSTRKDSGLQFNQKLHPKVKSLASMVFRRNDVKIRKLLPTICYFLQATSSKEYLTVLDTVWERSIEYLICSKQ